MNQIYSKPVKPTDCFQALGTVAVNDCNTPQASEIRMLILSDKDATTGQALYKPSGDVSLLASWSGVIDNSAAAAAKQLKGAGDIPAAPETTVIANGVPVPIVKERILNFDMVTVSDEQEELLRRMQYGWRGFLWANTRGSRIIGGETGIEVQCTMAEPDYARGNEAIKVWKTKFVWYELISAPDNASPFVVFN